MSYATIHKFVNNQIDDSWDWNYLYTYIKTTKGVVPSLINNQLHALVKDRIGEKLAKMQVEWQFTLQPITDIYIDSAYQHEFAGGGNKKIVYLLTGVALFVLLIAYVNFINLSTSQSTRRLKEVGVRKVNGAQPLQLVQQFIFEAFIINVFSFFIAFTLIQSSYSSLAAYFQLPPQRDLWSDWPFFSGFILLSTILSALYPALVLSSFKPANMMKGFGSLKFKGILLKKVLVVIQFAVSLILILGTISIYSQLQFIKDFDLGFNPHKQLIVKTPELNLEQGVVRLESFKKRLLDISQVEKVALLYEIPGNEIYWRPAIFEGNNGTTLTNPSILPVGTDYFDVFDINLLAGRTFVPARDSARRSVVINNKAAGLLGFTKPEDAIGKSVVTGETTSEIVGVVANYYQESLKKPIKPVVFRFSTIMSHYFAINNLGDNQARTIQNVEAIFKEMFPDSPFEYFFLDEYYQKQYLPDVLFGKLFNFFALLAILVAALGIFALSLIQALQRTKEIGIRKVLGATVPDVLGLLSREYFRLMVLSAAIGLPVAYWVMKLWLNNFVVQVKLSWWLFIVPPMVMTLVIVATIAYNSIKVALTDPVKSIRYE